VRNAVEDERSSDDRRISVQAAAPEPLADDRDGRGTWLIFLGEKRPSSDRLNAQRAEDIRRR
jgi:hypothetical protein